ncbi:MAG: alanine racemase [Limnobacter sp.]|nr:alanine racemase [Limnobacter sp.]
MSRPIRAIICKSALAHNIQLIQSRNPDKHCMAVVKADAYGHRLNAVIDGLKPADGLAILEIHKAVELRQLGWTKPILLLEGLFHLDDFKLAIEHQLDWVIHCQAQLDFLVQCTAAQVSSYRPRIYLKLNTGMNRLGFPIAQAPQAIAQLDAWAKALGCPSPVLMTHFANADAPTDQQNGVEVQAQHQALFKLKPADWASSLGNSAGALNWSALSGDIIRPGIAIYGASPGPLDAASYGLKPVMEFQTEVIALQDVPKGAKVGYGSRWQAPRDSKIAVIACGYADGYPRHAPDCTPVVVNGQMAALAGRVSMDMMTVDITGLHGIQTGSTVELWGNQLPVDVVAQQAGTISYELLCALAPRVPFTLKD